MTEPDKKDKVIAHLSMAVVSLSLLVLTLLIILLCVCFYKPMPKEEAQAWCGNSIKETAKSTYVPTSSINGERIFKQNCAVCHSMYTNVIVGPGLAGVMNRVPSKDWLYEYISNSEKLFNQGDAYAQRLSIGANDAF